MKRINFFLIVISVIFLEIVIASSDVKKSEKIVPVRALFENPSFYDGKVVTVKGEVIGDIMKEGEAFWINIKDGDFFIGIIIDASNKEKIKYTGRYRIVGDTIEISGTYHLHCPVHYGERDIHTEQFEIVESGYVIPEMIQNDRIIGCILLGIVTIFILLYSQRESIRKDNVGQQKQR
ncbi:MAG: DNA-binding protein [bacterium]|nr:DNA-binding protein [bacterium]